MEKVLQMQKDLMTLFVQNTREQVAVDTTELQRFIPLNTLEQFDNFEEKMKNLNFKKIVVSFGTISDD